MTEGSSVDLEVALAEAIHRAKNDLAAIEAMLRLQAEGTGEPAARTALLDAAVRVRALANLNTRLNKLAAAFVDSEALLDGLAADIRAMHLGQRPVTLNVRADSHPLLAEHAKPVGLIVNELVVNAMKYAFPGDRDGTVSITFEYHDGGCTLTVADNGIGMDPAAPPRGTGLGRRMVRAMAAQIGGAFQIVPGANGGTECTVRWRLPKTDEP